MLLEAWTLDEPRSRVAAPDPAVAAGGEAAGPVWDAELGYELSAAEIAELADALSRAARSLPREPGAR